jgi:ankyrin repeat protein
VSDPSQVIAAVRLRSLGALQHALEAKSGPVPARAVVEAAQLAWLDGLAIMIRYGADLNVSDRHYRPLHALIQDRPHNGQIPTAERVACLEWLLEHGANPEALGGWPFARAMVIAAFVGAPEYVTAISRAGAKTDVFTAAALGDVRAVSRRIAQDRDLVRARDAGVLTALHCCAGSRLGLRDPGLTASLVETARVLLDGGAELGARARSWGHDVDVAYFAVRAGQAAMLRLLLDRGLDPTAAVAPAAWDSRADLLDLALAHGARIDEAREHARPILNELVRWGQFAQARLLLDRGADPNVADDRGWTALHQAVSRGNAAMIEALVRAHADGARQDRSGQSPRDLAKSKGRTDLVRLLAR